MPHRQMPYLALLALLGIVLLTGCASQPYPPLPSNLPESDEGLTGGAQSAPLQGPADLGAESTAPVSQEVNPLPPDPAALASAEKRQLDIRLATQRFNYFEDDQLVWTGPISSGTPAHPTPKGRYQVQSKQINKRSGSYTNAFDRPTPMPYSLQFRGPYFVHEGYVTGHPESHGCVRLRHEDAKFVYQRMRLGDRIVVAD
ncbi:MAG: L,D-transpeptidase [Lamprobacter sp.]|uniref:L,D-transpeptidase n=1 Tax=Lamprobacter sp. TaxID=3100796 RepID=UPI002B2594B7|nr:L,D-transpeptidase [Lamprobacter sp.]MEA3639227.1 L,D-transpeptidase [Lamprobacter sp.]